MPLPTMMSDDGCCCDGCCCCSCYRNTQKHTVLSLLLLCLSLYIHSINTQKFHNSFRSYDNGYGKKVRVRAFTIVAITHCSPTLFLSLSISRTRALRTFFWPFICCHYGVILRPRSTTFSVALSLSLLFTMFVYIKCVTAYYTLLLSLYIRI